MGVRGAEYAVDMATPVTDTSFEIAIRQQAHLRAMTPSERGDLLIALCEGVTELAMAGIAREHPDAGPAERRLRLLTRRYGSAYVATLPPDVL